MRLVYTEKGDLLRKEMFRESYTPSFGPTPVDFNKISLKNSSNLPGSSLSKPSFF